MQVRVSSSTHGRPATRAGSDALFRCNCSESARAGGPALTESPLLASPAAEWSLASDICAGRGQTKLRQAPAGRNGSPDCTTPLSGDRIRVAAFDDRLLPDPLPRSRSPNGSGIEGDEAPLTGGRFSRFSAPRMPLRSSAPSTPVEMTSRRPARESGAMARPDRNSSHASLPAGSVLLRRSFHRNLRREVPV